MVSISLVLDPLTSMLIPPGQADLTSAGNPDEP
jgi:hypothetical protein